MPPRPSSREGSLEAPTRHPIDWKNPDYYDEEKLFAELERVFDLCHGCRRCVSLCNSFPTLFDLVDESETFEVDGVAKNDYWKVVDECYLCDLCFMTKCPYIPPHEWNLDFPHLMLQAKAVHFKNKGAKLRDKVLTSTDAMGKTLARPVISSITNAVNKVTVFRKVLDSAVGIDASAWVPEYTGKTMRSRLSDNSGEGTPAGKTTGKVALFTTCYGNFNEPIIGEDLVAVFGHNNIPVILAGKEVCCGMPKLELGDLEAVEKAKNVNIPMLAKLVDEGYDIIAPVPSCALMFRQEIPLMFPDDADVKKVQAAIFDPFEYLALRHKAEMLNTDFKNPLNKVSYHAACHQRVQNFGQKTREVLALVPDTEVKIIERCSGHDGTYALKSEHHQTSMKIVRPVTRRIKQDEADHYGSDCPMAGHHIEHALADGSKTQHPISLLRQAYGI
ncbi:Fe-S oxidoreductase-like protein in Rubrerythrin cluster [hydrothermal vent metagenome]|uniref:Fe-S oxidoreductase-like protein in Rubrerythrin cluster n=1 Tax=hydrothermal vent metagenome TaxID=652676 RepID=A0A3B0SVA1_9ZZZZ